MKDNKGKKKTVCLKLLLLLIVVVCLIPVGQAHYLSMKHREQQRRLKELTESSQKETQDTRSKLSGEDLPQGNENPDGASQDGTSQSGTAQSGTNQGDTTPNGTNQGSTPPGGTTQSGAPSETALPSFSPAPPPEPVILSKYADLYKENNDLAGWLSIEGMAIDYPVMQSEEEDYYLRRDFYGNPDTHGCLYVRNKGDIANGTNFIIYGHYMSDKTMFGTLDSYLKESFFKEHPTISFDTLYEERTYEIIAVFLSQVYYSNEDVFKYYQFYEAETQEEFDYFYENIKALSLYDTGVTAEFGDRFLTLSTCSYHVTDGRLAVVAVCKE